MVWSIMIKKWLLPKNIQTNKCKTIAQKPYPNHVQMAQTDTLTMTVTAEKTYPLGPNIPF